VFGAPRHDYDHPQPALNNITIQFKTDYCGEKIYIPTEERSSSSSSSGGSVGVENRTNITMDNASDKNEAAKKPEGEGDIKIEMTVTLDGWNVLEGLKQLTKIGVASKINDEVLKDMWKTNKLSIFK